MRRSVAFLMILAVTCSIVTGQKKKYQPPAVAVPANLDRDITAPPDPRSVAELKWFQIFGDQKLQELVRQAFVSNYDVRASVARIDAARANLGIVRSSQFPTIGASGDATFEGRSRNGLLPFPNPFRKVAITGAFF